MLRETGDTTRQLSVSVCTHNEAMTMYAQVTLQLCTVWATSVSRGCLRDWCRRCWGEGGTLHET